MIRFNEGNPLRRMMMGRPGTHGGRPMGTKQGQGFTPQPRQAINPQLKPMMKSTALGISKLVNRGFTKPALPPVIRVAGGLLGGGKSSQPQQAESAGLPPMIAAGGFVGGSPLPPPRLAVGSPGSGLAGIGSPTIDTSMPDFTGFNPNQIQTGYRGGQEINQPPPGFQGFGIQQPIRQPKVPNWYRNRGRFGGGGMQTGMFR